MKKRPGWDYEATYSSNIQIAGLILERDKLHSMLLKLCETTDDIEDDETCAWYIDQINEKAREANR